MQGSFVVVKSLLFPRSPPQRAPAALASKASSTVFPESFVAVFTRADENAAVPLPITGEVKSRTEFVKDCEVVLDWEAGEAFEAGG